MASTSRRTFLIAGSCGALALFLGGGLYRLSRKDPLPSPYALDSEAISALRAICAALLQDALPANSQALDRQVANVLSAIAKLPLRTQQEVQELFALLTWGPTRRFLAGMHARWNVAQTEDVAAFLQSWRTHRISLLQSAYHALHDMIIAPWYGDESNWESIRYPGPLKELSQGSSS